MVSNAGVGAGDGELEGVGVDDGVDEGVIGGVADTEEPGESVDVADGVGEHESATARPVAVHPQMHGKGASDASGQ